MHESSSLSPEAGRCRASAIVPCFRGADDLAALLRSLTGQLSPPGDARGHDELIVVNSGLDDAVTRTAERFGVRCVCGQRTLLPGEARNLGAEHAHGQLLAFIDADCVAEPGWLDAAVAGLERGAKLVGGPVLDRLPWSALASADNLLQFADFGADRPAGPVRHVPSCNMAIRRVDFAAIGGFDHRGQRFGEDVHLTEQVNLRWPERLYFDPAMRVRHRGRQTLSAFMGHHYGFGYARGALGLHLSATQRRWARHVWLLPAVVLKRMVYLTGRLWRYRRASLATALLWSPMIMLALLAWAEGFRRGLNASPGNAEDVVTAPASEGGRP